VDSNIPLLKGSSIFANNVYNKIKKTESKENPFNVIHCYNWHCANIIKNLQNGIPRKIIFTQLTNGFMKERIQNKKQVIKKDLMEYKLIKASNRILCFDKGIGKEIQNRFSLPEKKISIIQRAFNWQDYQWIKDPGEVKKRYGLRPLDPLVLFVGKFNNDYGPDILVDSIPTLLKDNPQVRFLLIGDGELMWPIRIKAHYLLFEDSIHLVGHKEGRDLQELIQAADIVVIPNRITTTPYQVLAAWSSKKPVIATHTGGFGLIKHLENGILVYDHPKSIAWGIERILFDWEKGHEIAQKGWEEIQQNYTWDSIGNRIENIYQSKNNNKTYA
jgi:glycosyltransferase involved in cell wall biosynthesis